MQKPDYNFVIIQGWKEGKRLKTYLYLSLRRCFANLTRPYSYQGSPKR